MLNVRQEKPFTSLMFAQAITNEFVEKDVARQLHAIASAEGPSWRFAALLDKRGSERRRSTGAH